jgi:hypothetical protein
LSVVVVLVYALTGFWMETDATGITAPDGSLTVPVTDPELDCACNREDGAEARNNNEKKKMLRVDGRMD